MKKTAMIMFSVLLSSAFLLTCSNKLAATEKKCIMGISKETIFENHDFERDFALINIFMAWTDIFPVEFAESIKKNKQILMITWEPYLYKQKRNILPDIISGKYDDVITNFCLASKRYGELLFLRWGHEMNGDWYPWSGNTELYRRAYVHIFTIFQNNNCKNIRFVFSINNFDTGQNETTRFEMYYPGDEYVDIIGIDGYNWGSKETSKWESPSMVFSEGYYRVKKLSSEKPIFITEVGSSSVGGDKIKWIKDFLTILKEEYTSVKAVIWFNLDKEQDWSITNNKRIWEFYLSEMRDPYFTSDTSTIMMILRE